MPRDPHNPFDPVHRRPDADRYLYSDRLKAAEAQEHDSETAWAEFERLHAQGGGEQLRPNPQPEAQPQDPAQPPRNEQAFAPTIPLSLSGLSGLSSPPAAPPASEPVTVQQVLTEARRFNRVCPLPEQWQQLYDLLPAKIISGGSSQPPPPISGPAWHATSAMPKRMCLRDHIEWAEHHGALEVVMQFLQSLPESQWHHMDD